MKNHIKRMQNKEIIVRKRIAGFIEKIFRYFNYDFRHDLFKSIIYGETSTQTPAEEKMKNFYDAFTYLLSNGQRPLSKEILKRFYYLIYVEELSDTVVIQICSKMFFADEIEMEIMIVNFPLFVYQQLNYLSKEDRTIICLMFINYILVKNKCPTIQLYQSEIKEFVLLLDKHLFQPSDKLGLFLKKIMISSTVQEKDYYQKLQPLDIGDIKEVFFKNQALLKKSYYVESIYIHGSFAKGTPRIDSDIDLIIKFSNFLTFAEKKENIHKIANIYFDVFNRYLDIHLFDDYLDNETIKEFIKKEKIF